MGFHLPPFTSVPHLHLHVLCPASKMNVRAQLRYGPQSHWFITVSQALGSVPRLLFVHYYDLIAILMIVLIFKFFFSLLQVNKVLSQLKTSGKVK